jgi:hypothetical protein
MGDWAFLGRALPTLQSWLSLVGILGGALGYVMTDQVRLSSSQPARVYSICNMKWLH